MMLWIIFAASMILVLIATWMRQQTSAPSGYESGAKKVKEQIWFTLQVMGVLSGAISFLLSILEGLANVFNISISFI